MARRLDWREDPPKTRELRASALREQLQRTRELRASALREQLQKRSRAVTTCAHLDATPMTPVPSDFKAVCGDCLAVGERWVHLRRCLTCNRVSCCDSSPARHASAHARASGHPVATSAEPGEYWRWCYFDMVGS